MSKFQKLNLPRIGPIYQFKDNLKLYQKLPIQTLTKKQSTPTKMNKTE